MKSFAIRSAPRATTLAFAVLLGLMLSACSKDQGGTVDGIHLIDANALTVCTHLPYKPFQFTNQQGQVVGFDVDMLQLLAKDLGVKEHVVSMDWNQITSGAVFAAGKCDVAMGGSTITPKRAEAVLFSAPYFNATQAVLVKKDSGIKSLKDMRDKRLGIQTDTTGALYAQKHAGEYGYQSVVFDDLALETTAVSAGTVAGAINDNAPLLEYAKDNPGTTVAAEFNTGEHYGFMAKKNDQNAKQLIDRLNQQIAKSRSNGEYQQIYEKWFGQLPGQANSPAME